MVQSGQMFSNDVFFPGRVLVPNDLVLIGEDDVRLLVAIDVSNCHPVPDFNFRIDFDGFETLPCGLSSVGAGNGTPKSAGETVNGCQARFFRRPWLWPLVLGLLWRCLRGRQR